MWITDESLDAICADREKFEELEYEPTERDSFYQVDYHFVVQSVTCEDRDLILCQLTSCVDEVESVTV